MKNKKTLVLGTSANPERTSNLAVIKLLANGYTVVAFGKKSGNIGNTVIETVQKPFGDIDTITLYLNAANQKPLYDYIFSLHPRRIIFNPGAENEELFLLAQEKNIEALEACTLVLLSTHQY